MKAPIQRLKKAELVYLATHRCKHGHNFLEHYNCYEQREHERIGFLDIETTNLSADFGIMLSWCIKDGDSDEILEGVINRTDMDLSSAGDEDSRVVTDLIWAMGQFDTLVTYYGSRFDMPFIRTRAVALNLEFPEYGALVHKDLYFLVRAKFKLSSNRLEQACRVLLDHTDKTKIEYKYWRAAGRGDRKALDYVLDHNRKDVLDLEKLYRKIIGYGRHNPRSI